MLYVIYYGMNRNAHKVDNLKNSKSNAEIDNNNMKMAVILLETAFKTVLEKSSYLVLKFRNSPVLIMFYIGSLINIQFVHII